MASYVQCTKNNAYTRSPIPGSPGLQNVVWRRLAGTLHRNDPCSWRIHILISVSRWVEAFPCQTERCNYVVKALFKEIIHKFEFPELSAWQWAFTAVVINGVARALQIRFISHSSWRPQSSGKTEWCIYKHSKRPWPNHAKKSMRPGLNLLPIALNRTRAVPNENQD